MAADFSAEGLLKTAKDVFGEAQLRDRVSQGGPIEMKDRELLRIARSVVSAIAAAAVSSVGWPLPGTWPDGSLDLDDEDIAGTPYRELWPDNLLQKALELFNARTYLACEVVPDEMRRLASAAEKFLSDLAKGSVGLGLGGDTDTSSPEPLAARDRQGRNLTGDGGADNARILDSLVGPGWDSVI